MVFIGRAKVTLFHDRTGGEGKSDATILESFSFLMSDQEFVYKPYFTTITPWGWEDCIALQPADLVAFEVVKEAQAGMEARNRRKSFDAVLSLEAFGVHKRSFRKEAMHKLRNFMEHGSV
jgi:hypothetical protein